MSMDETRRVDEQPPVLRSFEADLEEGDGRTLEARIVPYGVVARVYDRCGPTGELQEYEEMWAPGAFRHQVKDAESVAHRVKVKPLDVLLNFEHQQGLAGVIGHGITLDDRTDGLYGTFRMHENSDGDKALHLVRERILQGMSLEAKPLRSIIKGGRLVERVKANLSAVALCRRPAYAEAEVLAVRTEPAHVEPAPPNPLLERLDALGYQPLDRVNVTRKPWDGSQGRFEEAEWARSCLLKRSDGEPMLPVLEPNGDLNVNALQFATAALAGASTRLNVGAAGRSEAARKLVRYYRLTDLEPPASMVALAKN